MRTSTSIHWEDTSEWRIDSCEPQRRAIAAGKIVFHGLTHGAYPGDTLAADQLPGLSGLGHWQTNGPQDWGVPTHRNEGIEICWCETGRTTLVLDDTPHRLHPGAISVTRPWEAHRLGDPTIGEGRLHWIILDVGVRRPNQAWRWPSWIILSPRDREELTRRLLRAPGPLLPASPALCDAFRDIARAVGDHARPGSVSTLAIRINELLLRALESLRARDPGDEPADKTEPADGPNAQTVRLFWEDIQRNPGHLGARMTVRTMAADCGIGVTSFIAHTKTLAGATPIGRLATLRLEHADKLLRETDLSVSEIARTCGFASPQYFTTRFGKKFGSSPVTRRNRPGG